MERIMNDFYITSFSNTKEALITIDIIIRRLREEYNNRNGEKTFNFRLFVDKSNTKHCILTFNRENLYLTHINGQELSQSSYPVEFNLNIPEIFNKVNKEKLDIPLHKDHHFIFSLVLLLSEGARFNDWFKDNIFRFLTHSSSTSVQVNEFSPSIDFTLINPDNIESVNTILSKIQEKPSKEPGEKPKEFTSISWLKIVKNWSSIDTRCRSNPEARDCLLKLGFN